MKKALSNRLQHNNIGTAKEKSSFRRLRIHSTKSIQQSASLYCERDALLPNFNCSHIRCCQQDTKQSDTCVQKRSEKQEKTQMLISFYLFERIQQMEYEKRGTQQQKINHRQTSKFRRTEVQQAIER
jgi:hypothetical protein